MELSNDHVVPFMAVHPGDILKEELAERGIKQRDFASRIGMQATHLNELPHGKRNFSPDVAAAIEDVLGIPAIHWLNLQSIHDFDSQVLAKRSADESQARKELLEYNKVISVPALLKRAEKDLNSGVEKLAEVKKAVQGRLPDELAIAYAGMFRKSERTGPDEKMTTTWMILAHLRAESVPAVKGMFCKADVGELIVELREIFNSNGNVVERVSDAFSRYGVKFGIEPKLDKASVDGFSFMHEGSPCIIVTKRFDKIDIFAFSVMHELGHVVNDLNSESDAVLSWRSYGKTNSVERAADKFAADGLVPNDIWVKAPLIKPDAGDMQRKLSAWARQIGYNKWLVLGRAAHELNIYNLKSDGSRRIG